MRRALGVAPGKPAACASAEDAANRILVPFRTPTVCQNAAIAARVEVPAPAKRDLRFTQGGSTCFFESYAPTLLQDR